jgi:16S rRNA processing protein RimM
MEKYLEAGKINNTHGLNGYIKFDPWFDSPESALDIGTLYIKVKDEFQPLTVEKCSVHQNILLMKLKGYDDFDSAVKLKNKILYCNRDDIEIEEGSHFVADIIGLKIIDADSGEAYGTLKDVMNHGASDIYEIENDGKLMYMPAVSEFVIKIDLDSGIYIRPIEGMFE